MNIRFTGGFPALGAVALFVLGLVLVLWAYRRTQDRLSSAQLSLLTGLRVALIVLLLGCLVEPVLSYRAVRLEDAPVLFLADSSQSMSLRDTPGKQTRLAAALEPWLRGQRLAKALERRFAVRYFAFDAATRTLNESRDLEQQQPAGEMTLIAEALTSAATQTATPEISGIVLLTDGADQSATDAAAQAHALGAPVYVVAVGDVGSTYTGKPDLAVTDVTGQRFMSANTDNEMAVRLEHRMYAGRTATVQVRQEGASENPTALATESVALGDPVAEVKLRIAPTKPGKQTFLIVAHTFDGEEVVENNQRKFTAIVEDEQVRVLYIEGTPRWEYKFLKRALEWDPIVSVTAFVQSTSGLFLRQGDEAGSGALPTTKEDFGAFHVVLLGDVAPSMFSSGQLEALRAVVVEGGNGLGLVPGPHSTESGGFGATPLASVLPAVPIEPSAGSAKPDPYVPRVTAAGWSSPIFAGLDELRNPGSDLGLPSCFALGSLSPAASMLAVCPSVGGDASPLLLSQTVGKGRALVLATDSTWRWRMKSGGAPVKSGGAPVKSGGAPEEESLAPRSLHARFWGQAVRWLAGRDNETGGASGLIAYAGRDYYDAGQKAVLFARFRREQAEAADVDVAAEVQSPTGTKLSTPLEFVAGSGGLYHVDLDAPEAGGYSAHVSAKAGGQVLAEDTAQFYVGKPHREFERVAMNETLLRKLAFESGGAFHTPADAASIPEELAAAAAQRALLVEKKLAHMPATYGLMVACAALEWFLRKRRGLI